MGLQERVCLIYIPIWTIIDLAELHRRRGWRGHLHSNMDDYRRFTDLYTEPRLSYLHSNMDDYRRGHLCEA